MQRKFPFSCLALLFAAALQGRVTVTPDKPPPVGPNGIVHFKANGPVKWSLEPGSIGSIEPDGVYYAPTSVPVKNALGGCQLLGNDHVLNSRIDMLPVDARSAGWMSIIPPGGLNFGPAWGITLADRTTPKKKMHFLYTPQNDGQFDVVAWPALKRQSGVFSDPQSPMDRHTVTVNHDTCQVTELYNEYEAGTSRGCPGCTANSGVHYESTENALPSGSVDAAGLLLAPLTLRLDELRSGVIQHALRVTFKNNIIAREFTWPARANAGAWGKIPYGTRLRLKAGFDVSRFSPYARTMLTELKEYGLLIADGGANWDVTMSNDTTLDPAVRGATDEINKRGPRTSDFEIVDERSLISNENSGGVNVDNELLKPDGYAVIVATGPGHKDVARVRVSVHGVTVGVPNPSEWIQSRVSTKFTAWINGTGDKKMRWSVEPALGTMTPEGVYTAPDVQKPTHAMLTVASVFDPKAQAHVDLTVMPAGPIRISVGNATGAPGAPNHMAPDYGPDSDGNMWWRGQAGEMGWGVINDDWYGEPWPKLKDISLFYTSHYSFDDMVYRFMVPNGRYKITLLFAQPQCKTTFPKAWRVPFHLETQGQLVVPDFDMGAGIGYACLTPVVESIPAAVSDNHLYFALRRVTHRDQTPSPLLNAFSITADDAPPHLSISPAKIAALNIGQQIQLHAVGWSMNDKVTWSVVKGPGSISDSGLYTAPSLPPQGDQAIVLQAKSVADPSKVATAEMVFKFGDLALSPKSVSIARSLSTKFAASIDGTPYTNLNWSVDPPVGAISADGTYTAPERLASNTHVTVKATSKDVAGRSDTATIEIRAAADPIRVDCGSNSPLKDAQGNVWAADYGFSTPSLAYGSRVPIAGAPPDLLSLYQTARYTYPHGSFNYNFAVPNGRYAVTLKFADYAFNEAGHYAFDVLLNGVKVLANFDPDKEKGSKTAIDRRFETTVTNRAIRIDINARDQSSTLNGIEILPLGN